MYIYVDSVAAFELARSRKFQTTDFEEARSIISFIRKEIIDVKIANLRLEWIQDNAYIYCINDLGKNCLIIDLQNFNGFKDKNDSNILNCFNRMVKMCVKAWDGLPLNSSERSIGGNIYVLFPFAYETDNAYRIMVSKNPDVKRDEPRNRFNFLVFGDGNTNNLSTNPGDESVREYKSAIEKSVTLLKDKITDDRIQGKIEERVNGCLSTYQTSKPDTRINGAYGIDEWKHYLSDIQKRIVYGASKGPLRIDGAAGTGKTLAMILKSINMIMEADKNGEELSILFITHSMQTKNNIMTTMKNTWPEIEKFTMTKYHNACYLKITTLQELCIEQLGSNLNCLEYLDIDAMESKITQLLYLKEIVDNYMNNAIETYKGIISNIYYDFLKKSDTWQIAEMLRHEIGVVIKGRAQEDLDTYLSLKTRPKYGLPLVNEDDYRVTYAMYSEYKDKLIITNSFDSDDIVLSSYNTLTTPIWRRRKKNEGYDVILVDETHLFNINELSIIHHMLKEENNQIIFSIDKSQAIGDLGYNKEFLTDILVANKKGTMEEKFNTVFRSSTDIVNLASWILSSGTTLFDSIENNYVNASSAFDELDERKMKRPYIVYYNDNENMFRLILDTIDEHSREMGVSKSKILIIATDEHFFKMICDYFNDHNKSYEKITKRGDVEKVNSAIKSSKYVIAHIDYVGGLEFDSVIIVGAEKGVFPDYCESNECRQFINYSTYNRLYVAISRAKYRLTFIVNKELGISEILESALNKGLIEIRS